MKVAEEIPADRVGVRLTRRGRGRCCVNTPGSSLLFNSGYVNENSQERVIYVAVHIFIVDDLCLSVFIDLLIVRDKVTASCSGVRLLLGLSPVSSCTFYSCCSGLQD